MNAPALPPDVHLLLVEASSAEALVWRELLSPQVAEISVATDAAAALKIIAAERLSLVLCAVHLPDLSGMELCRQIKAQPASAALPVLLTTAAASGPEVIAALVCGASGLLVKPYEKEQVLTRLHSALTLPAAAQSEPPLELVFGAERQTVYASREELLGFVLAASELALAKERELQAVTEQLATQTGELGRSNADLAQFASIASHDLQEPLRMVSSYLGLLERRCAGQLDEKQLSYLQHALDGAVRMQGMIADLLAYSRVGTGARETVQADLAVVFAHALRNLELICLETGAKITHDPLPVLRVDPAQFTQLLQNLFSNALKFRSTERPVEIHLGCELLGGEWLFAVEDNGIGIVPADFERIFALFQRLHSRAEYPGTGIGLAVCKKIVERHGGRIWLESEVGRRTSFFFTVPAA